jgi:GNAT superfamily N-acetyltransferase
MCIWLTAEQAQQYRRLTAASLALSLDGLAIPDARTAQRSHQLFAAGLTFAGLPAALVIVRTTSTSSLELLSLAVLEPFRRLGLATQLLSWLHQEASRLSWSSLSVSYPLGHACTQAMARLTDSKKGWEQSKGLRLFHFDRAGGKTLVQKLEPVYSRLLRSGRFRLVRWQCVSQEQIDQIHALQHLMPSWAWPLQLDNGSPLGVRDDHISQLLLDRGEVIGWLIAHRVGLSMFRVTQWWVIPEHQGSGFALMLLQKAVVDAIAAQPHYTSGCFGVDQANKRMLQLSKHHLEKIACDIQSNHRAIISVNQIYNAGSFQVNQAL